METVVFYFRYSVVYSRVSQLYVSFGLMSHCEDYRYTDVGWYNRTGIMRAVIEIGIRAQPVEIAHEYT